MAGRPRKLGPEEQARIIEMRDRDGMTLATIAKQFSVGIATVSRICSSAPPQSPNLSSQRTTAPVSSPGRPVSEPSSGDKTDSKRRETTASSDATSAAAGERATTNSDRPEQRPQQPPEQPRSDQGKQSGAQRPVLSLWREQAPADDQGVRTTSPTAQGPAVKTGSAPTRPSGPEARLADCPIGEIQDTTAAVTEALERWRRTRAREDYAQVDKALADVRKALAKAEVELWTWQ